MFSEGFGHRTTTSHSHNGLSAKERIALGDSSHPPLTSRVQLGDAGAVGECARRVWFLKLFKKVGVSKR